MTWPTDLVLKIPQVLEKLTHALRWILEDPDPQGDELISKRATVDGDSLACDLEDLPV